jgi:hypothetical protein
MEQRHQEYVEYYRARLARAQSNAALYPHSAAAERALFEAISTARSLDEFRERERAGKLSLGCAIARIRDVQRAEADLYLELEETVRAQPYLEVLRLLDQSPPQTVEDLNTLVSSTHDRFNREIVRDETLRDEFWGDWKVLEEIECDERAEVPERWREERRRAVAEELQRGTRHWREHVAEVRKLVPDYEPDWNGLWEMRHRRRFPLADKVVAGRVEDHKRYVGVE